MIAATKQAARKESAPMSKKVKQPTSNMMEAFEQAASEKLVEEVEQVLESERKPKKSRNHYNLEQTLERKLAKGKQTVHNLSNDGFSDFILMAISCGKYALTILRVEGTSVLKEIEVHFFNLKQAADFIEFIPSYSGSLGKWRKL